LFADIWFQVFLAGIAVFVARKFLAQKRRGCFISDLKKNCANHKRLLPFPSRPFLALLMLTLAQL